eukprot:2412641-Pleurochrysis_carterae.AAC.1
MFLGTRVRCASVASLRVRAHLRVRERAFTHTRGHPSCLAINVQNCHSRARARGCALRVRLVELRGSVIKTERDNDVVFLRGKGKGRLPIVSRKWSNNALSIATEGPAWQSRIDKFWWRAHPGEHKQYKCKKVPKHAEEAQRNQGTLSAGKLSVANQRPARYRYPMVLLASYDGKESIKRLAHVSVRACGWSRCLKLLRALTAEVRRGIDQRWTNRYRARQKKADKD